MEGYPIIARCSNGGNTAIIYLDQPCNKYAISYRVPIGGDGDPISVEWIHDFHDAVERMKTVMGFYDVVGS